MQRTNSKQGRFKYRDGPGAGRNPAKPAATPGALPTAAASCSGRPSSVSRALQIIGDKWSFMVVREAFFGNRRYDKIQSELGIAPNILTDRLSRLVAQRRVPPASLSDSARPLRVSPDRHGPRSLRAVHRHAGVGGPLALQGKAAASPAPHRNADTIFRLSVICDQCQKPIDRCRHAIPAEPTIQVDYGALGPSSSHLTSSASPSTPRPA